MRLHQQKLHVEKSGQIDESEFTIKATAESFQILSGGLYSDKILAIVRELSCNAWDAHVAAGKKNTPFEIKLPSALDPKFSIKDFGTGMSDETVRTLYKTYFDSTKRNTDKEIGMYGLGSKTPFAYTSSFSVESRHGGKKRLYTCFIGEKGVPNLAFLGEQDHDGSNGLTVTFAVKSGDITLFHEAARKALMYFKPQPKVTGVQHFTPYALKHTVKGSNWMVRESDYYAHMNGAYAIQGFVAYPIEVETLSQHGLSDIARSILNLDIDLNLKIGEVKMTPSREHLQYTPETIKNLKLAADNTAREMRDSIQSEFDKCKTKWDALLLHSKLRHGGSMQEIFDTLNVQQKFTFRNEEINSNEVKLDLSKIKRTEIVVMYYGRSRYGSKYKQKVSTSWSPESLSVDWDFRIQPNMHVLIDNQHKSKFILGQYLSDLEKIHAHPYVLVLKGTEKGVFDSREIENILDQLECKNFTLVSDLPYQRIKNTTGAGHYRAKKMNEVLRWNGYPTNKGYYAGRRRGDVRRVYSRLCWEKETLNMNDKEVRHYVEIDRFTIKNNSVTVEGFDTYLRIAQKLGLILSIDVYGLNEKQVKYVKRDKNWLNLFTCVEKAFNDLNKDNVLLDYIVSERVLRFVGNGIAQHVVEEWETIRDKFVDGEFKDLLDKIYNVYQSSRDVMKIPRWKKTNFTTEDVSVAGQRFSKKFLEEAGEKQNRLEKEFTKVNNKHSMLRLVDWNRVTRRDIDMIVEYVNFVAKS